MDMSHTLDVEKEELEGAEEFCYLDSIVMSSGGMDADVYSRQKNTRSAYAQLRTIRKSPKYSERIKLKIFGRNVMFALLNSCETWKDSNGINKDLRG